MESGSQFYIKDTKEGTPRDILGKEYYQRKRLNAEPSIAGNRCVSFFHGISKSHFHLLSSKVDKSDYQMKLNQNHMVKFGILFPFTHPRTE